MLITTSFALPGDNGEMGGVALLLYVRLEQSTDHQHMCE